MLITEKKKIETFYKALLNREQSFVGIFFVGVKTTTVFCIATCRARKPKLENVEFYTTFKEALDNGYRPCKICKPTQNANEAPEQVELAMDLVKNHPKEKVTDFRLRQNQISPEVVRRWFKKHYGMTFHGYQRMYRINTAFQELRNSKKVTATAFNTGYESLSGFGYTYKKLLGESPQNSLNKNIILVSRLTSPIGPLFVCATDNGICLLEFVNRRMLETKFKDLQRLLNANIMTGENKHIKQTKQELSEYFNGDRTSFDVELHTPGTAFQNLVWDALRLIPYGETTSFVAQAAKIKNPKAIRAVATANGCNRISILVPCHRVTGSDGQLTGYGGGLERKKWLLNHESEKKDQNR